MLTDMDAEAAVYLILLLIMTCFAGGLLVAVVRLSRLAAGPSLDDHFDTVPRDDTPEIR